MPQSTLRVPLGQPTLSQKINEIELVKPTKMAPTRIPLGGWGIGSKEPIQRMILLQRLQYQSTDKSELS